MATIVVAGRMDDWGVQRCRGLAAEMCAANRGAGYEYRVRALLEHEWEAVLVRKQSELGGACVRHTTSPLVTLVCEGRPEAYVGGVEELEALASEELGRPPSECDKTALEASARHLFLSELRKRKRKVVFLDLALPKGTRRVVVELRDDVCPRTSKNFLDLCVGREDGLRYTNSSIDRIVKGGWAQGGALPGVATFADEAFAVPFDRSGVVAMTNVGPHTNASQFFITFQPLSWLDKKCVAFGLVIRGLDVLRQLEALPTERERPIHDCRVLDCGIVDTTSGLGL